MKRIIITMLVAIITLATIDARPVRRVEHKEAATEQAMNQKAAVQANEQATEAETADDNATNEQAASNESKIKIGKNGIIIKRDGKDVEVGKNGIIVNKDGKEVEVKFGDLSRILSDHLDDTILSASDIAVETDDNEGITVGSAEYNLAQDGMRLAHDISTGFFIAVVWIVALSLLFYYLHRRRKYKTVDRAIQAGYPLPDEFFGKRSQSYPQQPTNVYVTQMPPIQQPADGAQQPVDGTQPTAMPYYGQSSNPLNNITDWTPFKSGLRTTAWGLGLLFFFWILGVTPVAALMVIVVFIGLGKLFIAYQEQQSQKNYWQQQQWTQQAQQQQQQWRQWNPGQHENVPPMPETPPEFDPMHNE